MSLNYWIRRKLGKEKGKWLGSGCDLEAVAKFGGINVNHWAHQRKLATFYRGKEFIKLIMEFPQITAPIAVGDGDADSF